MVGVEHGAKRRWRSEGGAHVCVALVIRCTHLVRRLEIRTGCHERARHCLVPIHTGDVKRCLAILSGGCSVQNLRGLPFSSLAPN